ncbi:AMP-binding protein [Arthrobacter sp. 08Y14]|uniref:AMP-binding protein n=1 Tax=Arthrobacter sp. 08Y14 TaxID=2058885 RepID=UPI000CE464B9|nr:AMP-binding protein [Arthrobacter sp. 08Y14]
MVASQAFAAGAAPAWRPAADRRKRSRLLAAMHRWGFDSLEDLHGRAVQDPEWFWRAVVEDLDIEFSAPFDAVLDAGKGHEFPVWFPNGRINAAQLCAHRHADGPIADKEAVVYEADNGKRRSLTYRALDEQVRAFAAGLDELGVRRGDRVVLFMPVVPEATVAFLAAARIGAIAVPAFTGLGVEALAVRLRDSGAAVLITADGTTRRGKTIDLKATADAAVAEAPNISTVVVVRNLDSAVQMTAGRDVSWDDAQGDPGTSVLADTESNDPLTIIYTSGTTGSPKGIVLSHAGFLVKGATDFAYGFDIHQDDVIAWIADMGWMLGPLLIIGSLQLGATVVMTEGVPDYPTPQRLWEVAERNKVTFQGVAPTAARLVRSHDEPVRADIGTIRSFASTGEPWDDSTWHWLFDEVGAKQRPIVNYTGGTETGGGILVAYPFLPMSAGGFNGPLPGMDAAVLDETGRPVAGEHGQLAVLNTWPGMTHAFWQDRKRYLETYWNRWPKVWVQGDLASVDTENGWRLHGRSDDTIKVSGRRVGPSEIETALLKDARILEAAAVGVPDEQRGQRVAAFIVLRQPHGDLTDITATAVANVGRSFAPSLHFVGSVPKTKNGKIMRRAIRSRFLGTDPGDLSALDPATPMTDIPTLNPIGAEQ